MKTLGTTLLLALTVLGLWAQDGAESDAAKGKGKAAGAAKAGGGRGKAKAVEAPPAPPNVPQVMRLLRPSLYLVTGHGANALFRVTPMGVILVNTKAAGPGDFEELRHYVEGVSKTPVKWVLNSKAAPEATGNNAKFQAAGAEIVSGARMVQLGGAEARALAFGANTVVYFPADRVIYLGDLYATAGATAPGAGSALDAVLKLDWTVAVPTSGEPVYRAAVEKYRKSIQ